ncbi:ribosome production factor 2 homolog, partial [Saccoglossus kowalevskii]|uniref:Ribosome production factor 2 homolog n=1 Tax=Saccoglossus kowalevskii TaxID=10224 RepID=A0ABM0GTH1_SACKO
KPRTQRAKRALEQRAPKLVENTKKALFIKGGNTSEIVTQILRDCYALKKGNAILFKKKNILKPFEDQTSLEFFSEKNDTSLFMYGSHSKKRPHNIIIGRTFSYHVLDMIELGVENFKSLSDFKNAKYSSGSKPCLVFSGEPFEQDTEHKRLKSLLVDFFRGPVVTNVRLAGLEHALHFVAIDGKIYLRSYRIILKKSGSRTPRVELEEIGPSLDLVMRRTRLAADDLFKKSMKQPKEAKIRKVKNVSRDVFGTKHGRIHMQKQDLNTLQLRKLKGLKRKTAETENNDNSKKAKSD